MLNGQYTAAFTRACEELSVGLFPGNVGFDSHTTFTTRAFSPTFPRRRSCGKAPVADAEHALMWAKAELFKDTSSMEKILAANKPLEAIGRSVKNFSQATWDHSVSNIIKNILYCKLQHELALQAMLGVRGGFFEASATDQIWGIGISIADAKAGKPQRREPAGQGAGRGARDDRARPQRAHRRRRRRVQGAGAEEKAEKFMQTLEARGDATLCLRREGRLRARSAGADPAGANAQPHRRHTLCRGPAVTKIAI